MFNCKKEACLQDSPPTAGHLERHLTFCHSVILPGRAFYAIENFNRISYYIKMFHVKHFANFNCTQ